MFWTSLLLDAALTQAPGYPPPLVPAASAPADGGSVAPAPEGLSSVVPDWSPTPSRPSWGFENFFPRVGVQHRARGYGYDRGYTSFDAFVPLFQSDFSSLTAFQGNLLLDNGGDIGFNTGLVQRQYIESWDRIVGINAFYSYRDQDGNSFNQLGFGIETLGSYLDWRMNGYLPVGEDLYVAPNATITSAAFSGRALMVNFLADRSLAGFDTEIGGIIPSTLDMLRAYAGFYHFLGNHSGDIWGVQGRVEARLQDALVLHCGVTNDNTFGTNVILGAGFYFGGFAPRNTPPNGRAAGRLGEDVWRNQNIIIERSPLDTAVPARWANGALIDVVHVNSAATVVGDGSLALPVQTLTEAQTLGVPGSLIFVQANSTFTGESIALQEGQQLRGEGITHTLQSLYGQVLLPTVTPPNNVLDVPLLTSSPGTGVTLANNTVLSGFQVNAAGGTGVAANGVTDVVVDRVRVNGAAADGINLNNVSGVIQVTESFVTNNSGAGIAITTAAAGTGNALTISDNTVLQNDGLGLNLNTTGPSQNTLVMETNLFRIGLGPTDTRSTPLMLIASQDASQLVARIENNDIEDTFARDDTSPDEDPYYHQFLLQASNSSRVDMGFINNRFTSDRRPFLNNPRNGSFGLNLQSTDLANVRIGLNTNTASLNYAFSENFISVFQLENTLSTNTGEMFYFPTANQIDVIPGGTLQLP